LPKYSPDLNPIEQVFAKLKHLLRKAAARTADAVYAAIADALDDFTPRECANYLTNSQATEPNFIMLQANLTCRHASLHHGPVARRAHRNKTVQETLRFLFKLRSGRISSANVETPYAPREGHNCC
jgi:hypothetical protein